MGRASDGGGLTEDMIMDMAASANGAKRHGVPGNQHGASSRTMRRAAAKLKRKAVSQGREYHSGVRVLDCNADKAKGPLD